MHVPTPWRKQVLPRASLSPLKHTHTHTLSPSLSLLQAFLDSLTSAGRWAAAAARLPGLLREDVPAWERWLYTFAQVGCRF